MTKFEGCLMGMGNPLLDISATVEQDILDKYGLKMGTAILAEEAHQPLYQELIQNYPVQYIAGGATQNSMRVAQWMLTAAGKPAMTAFLGCIGKDDYGKQLEECAGQDGVYTHYQIDETTPTGTCAALILKGERALVANLAAANNFSEEHLETEKAKEIMASAKIHYSAGFFLTVSVPSLLTVAESFSATPHKIVCLNLSAPFIVDFFADAMAAAMPYADYLFGNESEAAAYGNKHGLGDNLKDIALAVAALPKKNTERSRTVIFTQGSEPTIVAVNGAIQEFPVEALSAELLVDTNGAGDAFVGGFLAELSQSKDLEACIKAAHWAARYIIQVSGTTLSGPCQYEG